MFEIVPGGRVRRRGQRLERPVDRLVEVERRVRGIRGLRERLRLVAQLLSRTHAVHHARLCDREDELIRRIIIRTQGIARGARALHGQEARDIGVGAAQVLVHPRREGRRVVAGVPGVQVPGGDGPGRCGARGPGGQGGAGEQRYEKGHTVPAGQSTGHG